MPDQPRISVIVPVYNGEKYVAETLRCILSQGMPGVEILVIDDGSTDGTAEAVRPFLGQIIYRKQENQGISGGRNHGLALARGEFLAFLDADDLWLPGFLHQTLAALEQPGEKAVGAVTGWENIDASGAPMEGSRVVRSGRLSMRDYYFKNPMPVHTYLVRAEAVRAVGGFSRSVYAMEDWNLWVRITAAGGQFVAVPACLAQYRLHGMTVSRSADKMKAGRLATAQILVECLPPADRGLGGTIMARAHLENAALLLAEGRPADSADELRAAAGADWSVIERIETLYALACVRQPVGRRGGGYPLDLAAARAEARAVLEQAGALTPRVGARLDWVLGRLAYAQRDMTATRQYLSWAARRDPSLLKEPSLALTYLKSLLGAKMVRTIKGNLS